MVRVWRLEDNVGSGLSPTALGVPRGDKRVRPKSHVASNERHRVMPVCSKLGRFGLS